MVNSHFPGFRRVHPVLICMAILIGFVAMVMAQDAPADPLCPGAPAPRLVVSERGQVSPGQSNNLRDWPARSGARIGPIPAGGEFVVLEGPVCADGFNWWRVDYDGLVGWTVEGQGAEYWAEPITPDSAAPESSVSLANPYRDPQYSVTNIVEVDAQARLQSPDGAPLALRATPDTDGETVADLPDGTIVTLLEEGAGGWWRVQAEDGAEGWLLEGIAAPERFAAGRLPTDFFPTIAPLCPFTEDRIAFAAIDARVGNNLYTISMDGRRLCNLTYGAHLCYDFFAWSLGGSALVFNGVTATGSDCHALIREADLYTISADGRNLRRLTNGAIVTDVAWSPAAGDAPIAFLQQSAGNPGTEVYVTNPDGTQMRFLALSGPPTVGGNLRWSPDGTRLAFIRENNPDGGSYYESIILIDPVSGDESELFASDWRVESLAWGPNGLALLASVYINVGQNVLVEIDARTREYVLLYEDSTHGAVYASDGERIAVWRNINQRPRQLVLINRETDENTILARLPGVNRPGIAWTLDEQAILVASGGVLRVDVATGQYRHLFLGSLSSRFTPPLPQPRR